MEDLAQDQIRLFQRLIALAICVERPRATCASLLIRSYHSGAV